MYSFENNLYNHNYTSDLYVCEEMFCFYTAIQQLVQQTGQDAFEEIQLRYDRMRLSYPNFQESEFEEFINFYKSNITKLNLEKLKVLKSLENNIAVICAERLSAKLVGR